MQNARSGHASLVNEAGLIKTVILGVNHRTEFPGKELLHWISANDISVIQSLVVNNYTGSTTNLHLSPSHDSVIVGHDNETEERLIEFAAKFAEQGVELKNQVKRNYEIDHLNENSLLFDLFCAGSEFLHEDEVNYSDFLLNLKCSVFVYPKKTFTVKHILLVFDGTPSSMTVMKNAIALFKNNLRNASITLLALHKPREKQFYREHLIVNFLLAKFNDVGVLAIQKDILESQVKRILKNSPQTLLISGSYGAKIILNSDLKNLIKEKNVPLFFTN